MKKIIVDAFGGDNAPIEVIKGAVEAINKKDGFIVSLVGDSSIISDELSKYDYDKNRIEIIHAPQVISNNESPTEAIRKKKDSSIVVGFNTLNSDEDAHAFVSAGSSGAVLTGAVLLVKRIKGVVRPALVPTLPTRQGGEVALIDCGANADCKPNILVQFAHLGKAFAECSLGIQNPRIGLLSNGAEDKKGNELCKEVFPLLKEDSAINFVGNIEARDILTGVVDVVVTDGFSGNIALKSCEGTAETLMGLIKDNILAGGLRAKLGYLLLKPALKKVASVMNYNEKGGAILLGLKKVVIKAHGSSKAKSISAAILQAVGYVEGGLIERATAIIEGENG